LGRIGTICTEAAQKGPRHWANFWLYQLTPAERKLARPMRAQYEEIAAQAEVKG
jgi:hypothetical protein